MANANVIFNTPTGSGIAVGNLIQASDFERDAVLQYDPAVQTLYSGNLELTGNIVGANASTAEVITGTLTDKFVSPASFTGFFNAAGQQSTAASGYQKLPGGLIIQWGTVSFAAATSATVTWSVPFPTACLVAIAANPSTTQVITTASVNTTTGSFQIPTAATLSTTFIALGN